MKNKPYFRVVVIGKDNNSYSEDFKSMPLAMLFVNDLIKKDEKRVIKSIEVTYWDTKHIGTTQFKHSFH